MSRSLITCSASRIVAELSSGHLTQEDVVDALTRQREKANGDINAFEFIAPSNHDDCSGPLSGLPITVKDQIAVAGMPLNHGLDRLNRKPPEQTAPVVRQFLNAGAKVHGKTTLPPYAMDFQTFNKRNGPTCNPWNLELTAGGSSGGGAAAVASGMSFLDIGADLSGSLRLPAAFCGVFSLMPTDGKVDSNGLLPRGQVLNNFARPGAIARGVDDLALAWAVMSDEAQAKMPLTDVQIAVWDDASSRLPASRSVVSALTAACETLSPEEGIDLIETPLEQLFADEVYACFGEIMGYETGALMPAPIRALERITGKAAAKNSPKFLKHVHEGYRQDKASYGRALDNRDSLRAAFEQSWANSDALLIPVCGVQPFPHQTPDRDRGGIRSYSTMFDVGDTKVGYFDALTSFTVPVSLMGNPVVTLPLGLDREGLPVGAQLVGKVGGELELLAVADKVASVLPDLHNPYLPSERQTHGAS